MENLIKEIHQSMRLIKNDMIRKYYDLRINRVKDPWKVMFRKQPYQFILVLGHTYICAQALHC